MPSPVRLAHAVLKTRDVDGLTQRYCNILDAHVVFAKPGLLSFITYDDEHHRLGISAIHGEAVSATALTTGLSHLAFTFDNVRDMLVQYVKMRDLGTKPVFNVNHGPTLSFYYQDPDGNGVELLVDRFKTFQESQDFIDQNFDRNPVGIACDPEDLLRRAAAGETDEQLLYFDPAAPAVTPGHVKIDFKKLMAND